jgi:hypothetical protein
VPKRAVLRPFPQFSNVSIIAADLGASSYHGVNLAEKRYPTDCCSKPITPFEIHRQHRARNQSPVFRNWSVHGLLQPGINRGLSGNDVRHRLVWSSLYELPFGTAAVSRR